MFVTSSVTGQVVTPSGRNELTEVVALCTRMEAIVIIELVRRRVVTSFMGMATVLL